MNVLLYFESPEKAHEIVNEYKKACEIIKEIDAKAEPGTSVPES